MNKDIERIYEEQITKEYKKYFYDKSLNKKGNQVISLNNNTLMIDIKAEMEKLSEREINLIKDRAFTATFTYNTYKNKNKSFEYNFIYEYNQKYISFKNEYILGKYLENYFEKSDNKLEQSFINDIKEKKDSLSSLNNLDRKEFDKLLKEDIDISNNEVIKKLDMNQALQDKAKEVYIEYNNKGIRFPADKYDFIFDDKTTLDIKTSNITNGTAKCIKPYLYNFKKDNKIIHQKIDNEKQINSLDITSYRKEVLKQRYHTFVSNNIENKLNIIQKSNVKNGKITTDVKDILLQTFYNPKDQKLYIEAATNSNILKDINNIENGRVGQNRKDTVLKQGIVSAIKPDVFLRYCKEKSAREFGKLEMKDYITYDNTLKDIISVYDKALEKNNYGINGIRTDEVIQLQNKTGKMFSILNNNLPCEEKDKCMLFFKEFGFKQKQIILKNDDISSENELLRKLKSKLGNETNFFIFKHSYNKTYLNTFKKQIEELQNTNEKEMER